MWFVSLKCYVYGLSGFWDIYHLDLGLYTSRIVFRGSPPRTSRFKVKLSTFNMVNNKNSESGSGSESNARNTHNSSELYAKNQNLC